MHLGAERETEREGSMGHLKPLRRDLKLRKQENNRVFRDKNPGYWDGRYEYVKQWS